MILVTGKRKLYSEHGFTLVELSLVGFILGLVSLLCWPSIRGLSQRLIGNSNEYKSQVQNRITRDKAIE